MRCRHPVCVLVNLYEQHEKLSNKAPQTAPAALGEEAAQD
jgi:hypothetical protein